VYTPDQFTTRYPRNPEDLLQWMEPGHPERLINVYIAQPRHRLLAEQFRLKPSLFSIPHIEISRSKIKGVHTHSTMDMHLFGVGGVGMKPETSEATWIDKMKMNSALKCNDHMRMPPGHLR
jgi:hypothetical protein